MRGNAARFPDKQLSAAHARAQLTQLLASATDERVLSFTVDSLVRQYRVPARDVECQLLAVQAKRRREIADRG